MAQRSYLQRFTLRRAKSIWEIFQPLGRHYLYALAFRTTTMKTPAGRAGRIAALVDMLERGDTPYPERRHL